MPASIVFFPVDNGDMTLITLADGRTILVDINIRQDADNPLTSTYDVASDLRGRLKRDMNNRPFVDVFLLSHPDKDHCTGLQKHFHLGALANYCDDNKIDNEKRIVIRELWSSPMVFRRASKNHTLCEDACAFNTEARRRVKINKENNFFNIPQGDQILIMGEDENGKTDDLNPILIKSGTTFRINNQEYDSNLECFLIAPMTKQSEELECTLSKNHSSVIINFSIASNNHSDKCRFLSGGDAEVEIWEMIWDKYRSTPEVLAYNILQTPHHCSWRTLSYDSWSGKGESAKESADAVNALSQARKGAAIVASSKLIQDEDSDPPCIRAKRTYTRIVQQLSVSGKFYCTGEYPKSTNVKPLIFEIDNVGVRVANKAVIGAASIAASPNLRAG
ncbi:metallohydrolase [Acinetobacter ursingii]|uniref:Metallohydrolase n=1 Tax=Acinetobacter ursingii TaxID=108980 RepID=A0A499RJP5_9GAMM|nr:metallohydrolase [Acinetobacter ursingii]AXK00285.1 metallohydrolase [Acinetobacter ursingii]UYF79195.1 metallohydrolase [Acinetobacter ursingii]